MATEVETEFEEESDCGAAEVVDEDLEAECEHAPSESSSNYVVPKENREVWKNFGCDTEAGRMLRRLYQGSGQKEAASKIAYPRLESPAQRWQPQPAPRKPCPQRAAVKVPKPTREVRRDSNDPKNWGPLPPPGRRPAKEILAELEEANQAMRYAGPPKDCQPGRDQDAEKEGLQMRFRYCGGRALPPGAMGHVDKAELPTVQKRPDPDDRHRIGQDGLNKEEREIFEELVLAVRRKQARYSEICAEEEAEGPNAKPSKARTARNKEALELRNDIDRNLADINKLLDLTDQQR